MQTKRTFITRSNGDVSEAVDLNDSEAIKAYEKRDERDATRAMRMQFEDGKEYVLNADIMLDMIEAYPNPDYDPAMEYIEKLGIPPEPDRQLPGPKCAMFVNYPAHEEVMKALPSFAPQWIRGLQVPLNYAGRGDVIATAAELRQELARRDLLAVIRTVLATYRRLDPDEIEIIDAPSPETPLEKPVYRDDNEHDSRLATAMYTAFDTQPKASDAEIVNQLAEQFPDEDQEELEGLVANVREGWRPRLLPSEAPLDLIAAIEKVHQAMPAASDEEVARELRAKFPEAISTNEDALMDAGLASMIDRAKGWTSEIIKHSD